MAVKYEHRQADWTYVDSDAHPCFACGFRWPCDTYIALTQRDEAVLACEMLIEYVSNPDGQHAFTLAEAREAGIRAIAKARGQ